jgi:hypothetical protein
MKCWSNRLLATLLVLSAFSGSARADMMTPWTYSWSRDPLSVASDGGAGTGGISLSTTPLAPGTHMTGDSDIGVVTLSTFSSAAMGHIDTFTKSPYALTIHLTDLTSGKSGDLTFNGQFNGSLSTTSADIKTTFLDPLTQSVVLGQHTYSVALNSYVPPGLPTATVFGSIGAHVSIDAASGNNGGGNDGGSSGNGGGNGGSGPGVSDAPEPSTLLLAGLALPAAGLAWWRARGLRGRAPQDD